MTGELDRAAIAWRVGVSGAGRSAGKPVVRIVLESSVVKKK